VFKFNLQFTYNFIIAKKYTLIHEIIVKKLPSVTKIFSYCSFVKAAQPSHAFLRILSYCLLFVIDFD